ncbi:uncharacterized protein LOC111499795 isoform X1 [Cucurbita maxima]|uniref:Uncharacterized protein LOC111499795 isoform X1 n=1 Tax=Cucurbita maxima TaxID=3661 RepID=A0A6J1L2G9_CUCMA|nr:uncharacterized protein LOC111499795 isoform X1 [Cucurbita maxima]
MFNFEDELIIQPRVSWLIWIQLLLLILVFALYCLTIFAIDFSKINTDSNSTAAIPSSSSSTSTSRFVSEIAHNHKNVSMHNIRIDSDPSRNAQIVGHIQHLVSDLGCRNKCLHHTKSSEEMCQRLGVEGRDPLLMKRNYVAWLMKMCVNLQTQGVWTPSSMVTTLMPPFTKQSQKTSFSCWQKSTRQR